MAGKTDRKFCGVLYPDSTSYDCTAVLDRLQEIFPFWAYVLHDKDVDANGEIKKAHYHWIGKQENPAPASTIANKLGVAVNDVCYCKSVKAQVQYLIHKNDPDKFQYPPTDVVSSSDVKRWLCEGEEEQKAYAIYEYIRESNCTSVEQLTDWALSNGNWSEFRRGFAIWNCIMNERKMKRV